MRRHLSLRLGRCKIDSSGVQLPVLLRWFYQAAQALQSLQWSKMPLNYWLSTDLLGLHFHPLRQNQSPRERSLQGILCEGPPISSQLQQLHSKLAIVLSIRCRVRLVDNPE